MAVRNKISFALAAISLCLSAGVLAQAPFTIRRPPDGSTVREKVRVEIPRASIRPGGFVAIYIDDKFDVALAPESDTTKPFTFVWNTKAENVDSEGKRVMIADGEHTVRAVLFEPSSQGSDAVSETASSEVKLNIANKIKNGPASLVLRYKFHEGDNLNYSRDSHAFVVGGESSSGQGTGDIDLNTSRSKLLLGVDDVRSAEDVNLVRNKLIGLSVLYSEKEITMGADDLTSSTYQELDSRGRVLYDNPVGGINRVVGDLIAYGIGLETSLQLPTVPITPVTVGQNWRVPGQSLEVPGLPHYAQPRVTMENKFEGLEWENGYQTAKIRQSFTQENVAKEMRFGTILITAPKVTVDKIIYFGYKAGKLVKTTRTMTIAGRTSSPLPTNTQAKDPPPGAPNGAGGNRNGQGPSGSPEEAANGGRGRQGRGGSMGRAGTSAPGGRPGGPPNGRPGGGYGGGGSTQAVDRPITIKIVTETELIGSEQP